MASRPFRLLLVLRDRAELRQVSRLLSAFGYQVRQASSVELAAAAIAVERPDILLLEPGERWEEGLSFAQSLDEGEGSYVYKLLVTGERSPADLVKAIEAGVDDFLAGPLERGELLARLRAGARVLEFERRIGRQGQTHKPMAAVDLDQLRERLAQNLARATSNRGATALAILDIDYFSQFMIARGRAAGMAAAATVEQVIVERLPASAWAGRLGENRFAAILPNSAPEAAQWTEEVRRGLVEFNADRPAAGPACTVSCGIAVVQSKASVEELVEQAEHALLQAKHSGRDCTVVSGQFADEGQKWSELAERGRFFEFTVARDIMVPCAVAVKAKDSIKLASELLEQTHLRALPVVDEEGKLAGLITAPSLRLRMAAKDCGGSPVETAMTTEVVSFDEQTTLAALIDYFTQESPLVIVIVHKGRPTGLVTPSSLATLSEQITHETFGSEARAPSEPGYLIVPNLCGVDAG